MTTTTKNKNAGLPETDLVFGRVALPLAFNFEQAAGSLPAHIELLPAGGTVTGRDGRSWNNPDPAAIVDYLNNREADLVLDWEHATELKAPEGDKAPAAAWLHQFRLEQGAVVASIRSWTPDGETAVRNREYRYISPVLLFDRTTMNVVGITSVGLTNRPNLYLPALNHEQQEEPTMLKKILAKLGLPETADETTALNAVTTLQTDLQTARNSATMPPLDKFVLRTEFDLALNRATSAEDQLKQFNAERLSGEIDTAINQALEAGKIAPANKEYYAAMCRTEGGLEQFKGFIAAAPKIVADSVLDGKQPADGQQTALNADQTRIMEMFGNTVDDLARYGK